jgi:hypothetical protein
MAKAWPSTTVIAAKDPYHETSCEHNGARSFDLDRVTAAHFHSAYEFYAHLLVAELSGDYGRHDCDNRRPPSAGFSPWCGTSEGRAALRADNFSPKVARISADRSMPL